MQSIYSLDACGAPWHPLCAGHIVLRMQVFVIDYRLVYPSGTATGVVISEFHTPLGEENAK